MRKFIISSVPLKRGVLYFLMCVCALGLHSCDDYDDTWLKETVEDLEDRVSNLEEWQKSVNTNISSLQNIIKALENKDYVTGVTPLEDGTGYIITFLKSGSVTIKHGEKGETGDKGDTPAISAKQDGDGKYYWTVNGEWLLDKGNKMPVTGEKGADGNDGLTPHIGDNGNWWIGTTDTGIKAQGEPGASGLTPHIGDNGNWWIGTTDTGVKAQGNNGADAIAPQVRINKDNEWEISTDGGMNWTSTGVKATGDKGDTGDSMFESIDNNNPNYIVFTLIGGETITMPKIVADGNTVHVATAGRLQQALEDAGIDASTATELTITGTLGDDDFSYLKANLNLLKRLDLSGLDITILPERALQGMSFETVALPEGLKEIKNVALGYCPSLRTLDIPESVETLGRWIVEGCDYLESITLHNGLKELSPSTFYGCGVTSIHIPETVTEIPDWCFQKCYNLERVFLHDDISTIGQGAFFDCYSLVSFKAPKSLTILSERLFSSCSSLRTVILHDKITEIGEYAFSYNTSLQGILTDRGWEEDNIPWPTSLETIGIYAFESCSALTGADMENTQITTIPTAAFMLCKNLLPHTTKMPRELEVIENSAFHGCESLTDIKLPVTLQKLDAFAFVYCTGLRTVTCFAESAPTIGYESFPKECKQQMTLKVPSGSDYSTWGDYFSSIVSIN